MNEKQNMELLQYVYQNVKMGEDNIRTLLPAVKDAELKTHLHKQMSGYGKFSNQAEEEIYRRNGQPKENSVMAKMAARMGVKMKTMQEHSPTRIAEMTIQGSTMGVVDMTKRLKEYTCASDEVRALAQKLLETEQQNIETMKGFLR